MFKSSTTKDQLLALIDGMSDEDFARFLYCQEMAGTYLGIAKFESMLISAMHMCDRVKLQKVLGDDEDRWQRSLEKKAVLQGATLGSLIKILQRHDLPSDDLAYLKWIKNKRDYFVHRLFHDHAWPGDLNVDDCTFMRGRLLAIQLLLDRAERNIWLIFERAKFVELDRLADGSMLAMNMGVYDVLDEVASAS